ncbi:MAG: tRNA preQ1(34) S-adenosylmethionine ribosyltransferase-isomerase QueA [Deltaproteobacteria bacterium]|nr:tRNA preQ1(34) S-adenosylmethionine ribosyltransferase-isomerase QueA [Deltaproteobacteria bacterium]
MNVMDFDYSLPEDLIAKRPCENRGQSRLMSLDRLTGEVRHSRFASLPDYLRQGDLLVLNDTSVLPARLLGRKKTGGRVEILMMKTPGLSAWRCMIKNSKGLHPGSVITLDNGAELELLGVPGDELWPCRLSGGLEKGAVERLLERSGAVPLPPYIGREAESLDKERYQTVFAKRRGAIAAPTAGLHFTDGLLATLKEAGVDVRFLTLHTGPGTFMPIRVSDPRGHKMPDEEYEISPLVFKAVCEAKKEGRRTIAVGTTTTRALEAACLTGMDSPRLCGSTGLFIYPGFKFQAVDGLITNFHLPSSTLLMLVCAFAGRENVMAAYAEAIRQRYGFFSYGDAMLIL